MIEAEITCECPAIGLSDLGLSLTKGVVVYIEADKARKSVDLQRAWKAQGVSVKYVQRFRERRQESSNPPPQAPPPLQAVPGVGPELPLEPPPLDVEVLAALVVELLTPKLQMMVEQALAGIQVQVVGGVPLERPSGVVGRVVADDDVPVFIPSRIGREDLRSTVEVVATEGEGGGVTDAVAALKAARKSEKP